MYDFPFRRSLLCRKPNLKVQPQPFQHQLPPEIPFESQYSKFLRHNEDTIKIGQQGNSNFYSLQKTKVVKQIRESSNSNFRNLNHKTYTFNENETDSMNIIAAKQLDSLLETKISKLEQIISQKDLTIQALEGQNQQISEARDILQAENIRLSEKLKGNNLLFINNEQKYQQIIKAYQQQIEKLNFRLANNMSVQLQRQNKVSLARIRKLETDLIIKQKQLAMKRRIHEEQNQQSRKLLEKLNQNVRNKQNQLKAQLQQSRGEVQALKKQIGQWKLKINQIQGDKQLTQSKSAELIQQKQQKIGTYEQKEKQIIQKYQLKLHQQQLVIQRLKQDMNLSTHQFNANLEQLEKYKQDRRNQQSILLQTQEKLNNFQQYLDKLEFDKTELQSKNQVLQADLQTYELKVRNLEQEKQDVYHQRQCLKKQMQHSDRKVAEFEKEIAGLKLQIRQKESTINVKNQQIKELEDIIRRHLANISDLQIENKRSVTELSVWREKGSELENQIRSMEQKNRQLTNKYYKSQKLLDLYKEQGKKTKSCTQVRWIQLKEVYQDQLQMLEKKLRDYQTKIRDLKKDIFENSQTSFLCKICNTNSMFSSRGDFFNKKTEGNHFLSHNAFGKVQEDDFIQQVPSFKTSLQNDAQKKHNNDSQMLSNRNEQGKQNSWDQSNN